MFTLTELGPKEAEMRIIGCDLHARQQTLAMLDTTTGEVVELTLIIRSAHSYRPGEGATQLELVTWAVLSSGQKSVSESLIRHST